MLTRVDRVQIVVRDRAVAARRYAELFGATVVAEDGLRAWGATRTALQAGAARFDLLEPSGIGPAARFLDTWGEGLFAAGFAASDLNALAQRLDGERIHYVIEDGQLFIDATAERGLRAVIGPDRGVASVPGGAITHLYEVTNLVVDAGDTATHYARVLGLDRTKFCPIESESYGYKGTLTLFDPPNRLDRIEVVEIVDPEKPMGRYFARRGPSLYMCFVETEDVEALAQRLQRANARFAPDTGWSERSIFIHPSATHGALIGVSPTSFAWSWSGHPELVVAP